MIGATVRRAIDAIDARVLVRALPFVVLIVLAAGVSYRYHQLLRAQRDRVDHTYEVLASLDGAFLSMVDAETGQRGYVITGDERYLSPYRDALTELPRTLDRLKGLLVDSPTQTARADALEALLRRKLVELESSIDARRTGGFDSARILIVGDHGKAVMDDIRASLADIRETETRLLAARTDQARRTERRLLWVTALCASLSTLARVGLAWGGRAARQHGRRGDLHDWRDWRGLGLATSCASPAFPQDDRELANARHDGSGCRSDRSVTRIENRSSPRGSASTSPASGR